MTPPLAYKRMSENGYRITTDGVEIGSVSLQIRHSKSNQLFWSWGVDVMPIMDHGGRPPRGEIDVEDDGIEAGFHEALEAFKAAFASWHAALDPALWEENLDHKRHGQERLRRLSDK